MVARRFRHQEDPNQNLKCQSQYLQRRVPFNEIRYGATKREHHDHRHDDGCNHDGQVLSHPNRRQNAVKTEHYVEQRNLQDNCRKGRLHLHILPVLGAPCFHDFIDFSGRFLNQKGPTQKEYGVSPIDAISKEMHERLGHANDPCNRQQHQNTEDECQPYAHGTCLGPNVFGQLVRQNANEDDVVDAQNDFQKGKRQKRKQGFEGQEVFHCAGLER